MSTLLQLILSGLGPFIFRGDWMVEPNNTCIVQKIFPKNCRFCIFLISFTILCGIELPRSKTVKKGGHHENFKSIKQLLQLSKIKR